MAQIYLDNAASAPMLPEVWDAMQPYMRATGNPSGVHQHGRFLKVGIERARKDIAACLKVAAAEILFTSGGTEANNWALRGAVAKAEVAEILSSGLEHPSVREVLRDITTKKTTKKAIKLTLVAHDDTGQLDMEALRRAMMQAGTPTLLSFMHANNEIGNVLDLTAIGEWMQKDMYLHSDMVQSIGHMPIALGELPVQMATASAHKFHGPRGIGFLYLQQGTRIAPLLHGGGQERGMRAGTEDVAAMVGMATALKLACTHMDTHMHHVQALKKQLIEGLQAQLPDISFHGRSADMARSLPTVLNISLPKVLDQESLLMCLDIEGISASVGSACASGSLSPSHVLDALRGTHTRLSLRISFSHLNTEAEVAHCTQAIAALMKSKAQPA